MTDFFSEIDGLKYFCSQQTNGRVKCGKCGRGVVAELHRSPCPRLYSKCRVCGAKIIMRYDTLAPDWKDFKSVERYVSELCG